MKKYQKIIHILVPPSLFLAGLLSSFFFTLNSADQGNMVSFDPRTNIATLTITSSDPLILDDSISPQFRTILKIQKDFSDWKIVETTNLQSCHKNRGHQDFSKEKCL